MTVRTGTRGLSEFLLEAVRAVRSHLRDVDGTLSKQVVSEYFSQRSSTHDTFSDVVATGSWTYRTLLHHSQKLYSNILRNESSILDYGCGQGHLLRILRDGGYRGTYTGYDINTRGIARLQDTQDTGATFTFESPETPFDGVFLINVMVYTSDAEASSLVEEVASTVRSDGVLVVADPFPAWYWETKFDGLKLRPRSPAECGRLFSDIGLRPRGLEIAAVTSVLGRPVLPIAWLVTFDR